MVTSMELHWHLNFFEGHTDFFLIKHIGRMFGTPSITKGEIERLGREREKYQSFISYFQASFVQYKMSKVRFTQKLCWPRTDPI